MKDAFFLASRYISFHRGKTATLVLGLMLALVLPFGFRVMSARFQRELIARADSIPWVVGERGSSLELVLSGLYFEPTDASRLSMADVGLAKPTTKGVVVPIHCEYQAAGAPVVGTTLGYFEQLRLRLVEGRMMGRVGDAVLGANVARRLGLGAGDQLLTDSTNRVNLAGAYPLKLRITGVFAATGTPDDDAVFVDIKTSWIIAGIGHGHEAVDPDDPNQTLSANSENIVASAAVTPYTEITDENVGAIHFHGPAEERPVSVILVWPRDRRDEDLMQGEFIDFNQRLLLTSSHDAVNGLIDNVVKLQLLLDAASIFLLVVSGLYLSLVMSLTYQLRAAERRTLHCLGCARGTILQMHFAEVVIVSGIALVGAGGVLGLLWALGWSVPRTWLI
ncbi:MAG: ABC transporter permease [Planctomycetales bacterium]|nr:ABC transporter permease [Planctomycetales bacterium]